MKLIPITIIIILICTAFNIQAQNEQNRQQHLNTDKNHIAIGGYDPVAYLSEQKAAEGKAGISAGYKGITYQFASEQNKKLFIASPEKYEPAYGGWCAYAMNYAGKKVEVDPKTFKIIDGKTYLFYNFYFNNTLTDWNKNETVFKAKADSNWKKIIGQ